MKLIFPVFLLFFVLSFCVQDVNAQATDTTEVELFPDSLLNKKVPYFTGTSLSGQKWNPEKLKGKVVLINFWYIGCPPCMKEIKYFNEINKEFKGKDFILLSIAPQLKEDLMNFSSTDTNNIPAKVRLKMKADAVSYEVISSCDKRKHPLNRLGPECKNISSDFLVDGYPTTFFVDKSGMIRYVEEGFPFADEMIGSTINKYKERINRLLKE